MPSPMRLCKDSARRQGRLRLSCCAQPGRSPETIFTRRLTWERKDLFLPNGPVVAVRNPAQVYTCLTPIAYARAIARVGALSCLDTPSVSRWAIGQTV